MKSPFKKQLLSFSFMAICILLLPFSAVHAQAIDQTTLQNYQNNCLNSAGQPIQIPSCMATQSQIQSNLTQLQQNYQDNCINSAGQPIQLPSCTALQSQIQSSQQSIGASSGNNNTDVTKAPYTLLTPLPELNGVCPPNSTCGSDGSGSTAITSISLSAFIGYAYKFMLAFAVVLAVFMITVGGFEYMLSGAMDTKSDAKKKMTDAILGLILALITYLLLYTIDPNLVSSNNLTIPPISNPSGSSANSGTSNSTTNGTVNTGNFSSGGGSFGGGGAGGTF